MSIQKLTVAEAADDFNDLVERTRKNQETTVITKNGAPVVIIAPAEPKGLTGLEFVAHWKSCKRLSPESADSFAQDARKSIQGPELPDCKWDRRWD